MARVGQVGQDLFPLGQVARGLFVLVRAWPSVPVALHKKIFPRAAHPPARHMKRAASRRAWPSLLVVGQVARDLFPLGQVARSLAKLGQAGPVAQMAKLFPEAPVHVVVLGSNCGALTCTVVLKLIRSQITPALGPFGQLFTN